MKNTPAARNQSHTMPASDESIQKNGLISGMCGYRNIRAIVAAGTKVFACFALMASVNAASITWESPANITADTDVRTGGTLIGALNLGATGVASTTINGVTFSPLVLSGTSVTDGSFNFAGNNLSGFNGSGSAAAPFTGLSAQYRGLLSSIAGNNVPNPLTVTMSNLSVGSTYQVQSWYNLSIINFSSTSTLTSGNSVILIQNTALAVGGIGQFATGTFLADGTSQAINYAAAVSIGLNGIQLRDITPGSAFWRGDVNGSWANNSSGNTNWATSQGGLTDTTVLPGPTTDITFSADGATNQNTTLGANFIIKSLTVNDTTPVIIGGGNTLTIGSDNAITVNTGADLTINATGLVLSGATPTITVNGSGTALISTAIDNSTASLTKQGAGNLTLTGANSYAGETIVRNGVLEVDSGGAISHSTADIYIGQQSGDVATLEINGNSTVEAKDGYVGYQGGASGTANINDGTWTNSNELFVGYSGSGTMFVGANGTVQNAKAFIGVNTAATGNVTVDGGEWTNTTDSLTVGYDGVGALSILNGGSVSSVGGTVGFGGSSDSNTVLISGNGSEWTSTDTLYIGLDGSSNNVTVSGGGALLMTVANKDALIGANAGSDNNVFTVTGNGSQFTNDGTFYVGRTGIGNEFSLLDGATATSRNVRIGADAASNGNTATVDGPSVWTVTGTQLRVGSAGDDNTLEITNGGTVNVTTGLTILGRDATSANNTVLISGNGSTLNTVNLTVGRNGVNNTVLVESGGNLTASTILLAENAGSSGTLQIGNGTAAGIINAPSVTGGNGTALLSFNHTDANYFFTNTGASGGTAVTIGGSTAMEHVGTGSTTITGANTYTGNTTISAGTLRTDNVSALGTGPVSLNAGTLDPVGQLTVNSLTWSGGTIASELGTATDLVSIGGNLTLAGGGTFDFTSGTGFAPNTTYNVLSASNLVDSFLAQFSGNQLLGITPTFTRTGTDLFVSFVGSSTGPLLQNVGGPWTPVNADFIVTGPVQTGAPADNNTVNSLLFNPNSSLQVFNNLTVTSGRFNVPSGTGTIAGGTVITPGDFNKIGAGNLIANSNFNVGGAANIQAGGLFVNGRFTVPGGLTVFQNALLGGSGTIDGNVFNNGTVNPGNSPGTLTVNGNFSQSSSGTLQIEIASLSVFDRLVVSGSANLAGTLQVLNLGNRLKYGQQYAFLQAGSINGEFDQILMPNPSRFRGRFLTNGGLGSLLVAPTSYTLVAETPNQTRVAKALDSYIPARGNDRETVSIALDLQTEEQYPDAFDQIAPSFHESVANISIEQAFAQTQLLNQRMSSVRLGARGFQAIGLDAEPLVHDKDGKSVADPKDFKSQISDFQSPAWSIWAQGNGMFAKVTNVSQVPNYRFNSGGFLFGADYTFGGGNSAASSGNQKSTIPTQQSSTSALSTGVFAGYQGTYADYNSAGRTSINSALFGLYASYTKGGFYADGVVAGGYNNYNVRRSIEFSTIDRSARSNQNGGQFSAALNLGYDWEIGKFTLGPIAGVQYTYVGIAPFTESGADSLNLRVGQQNANSLRTTFGGRVAYTWNLSESITIIPEIRMFWLHEFLNNPRNIASSLDGGNGADFGYMTSTPDRDSVFAGAGLTAQFGQNWYASAYWNIDFGRQDFLSHIISMNLGWKF